ncbi:MAG: murein biosynthesis integral membrane protein MurJ [Alphaproteobacteria bacterium]|nr:murein biosynthesis integral membrane protein MurJ [Alphaproteobacteria bacterium]
MNLLRSVATVGVFTLLSRVLGFARDIVIAGVIGTGPVADAWAVAFRFPNLFRRVVGEGAFNAAFVPLYAKRLEGEGEPAATYFAERILAVLLAGLLTLTVILLVAMPWIMLAYAPGFNDDPEKSALATTLTQVALPYLLFMSLCALYAGILNTHGRFGWAAGVQALLNVVLLAALGIVWALDRPAIGAAQWGHALAWGVSAAGLAQFLMLVYASGRDKVRLRLRRPRLDGEVRRFFVLAFPGIIAGGISQISIFIATVIATLEDGGPALLYYADRIYQFPLGLVGVAMGIVLLPAISRHLRGGRADLAQHWQNRGIEFAMLLTLPAAVALVVIAQPIVATLFERGAFTAEDSAAVASILMVFGIGLPAFILNKVLTPAFFAREDTATPMRFAVATLILDVALSAGFFFLFGVIGIAIGTTIAAWINVSLLGGTLLRRGDLVLDDRLKSRLPRAALASLAMGAGLLAAMGILWANPTGELDRAIALLALCLSGMAAYAVFVLLTRASSVKELREAFGRS